MRGAAQGLNLVDSVYERLLSERIIFLGSQVDDDIANRLCAQILLLAAEDPIKDINLYINSPGGSISAGRATSPPTRWAWRRRWASSCSPPAPRASAMPCRTPGS
jgi:hypothetical protein